MLHYSASLLKGGAVFSLFSDEKFAFSKKFIKYIDWEPKIVS